MSNSADPDPSQPIDETVILEERPAVVLADPSPSDPNAVLVAEQTAQTPAAPRPPVVSSIRFDVIQSVAGLILVVISQFLKPPAIEGSSLISWVCLFFGLLLFLSGNRVVRPSRVPDSIFAPVDWFGRSIAWSGRQLSKRLEWGAKTLGISAGQVLLLCFSLALVMVAAMAAGPEGRMKIPILAVTCWIGAIATAVLGGWQPWNRDQPFHWQPFAWALGFILLALPLRAINTTYVPVNLTGDEASAGLNAIEFLRGDWNNIFRTAWFAFPSLFFTIPAFFIAWLGQTTEALRLPSAIAGSLTVGGVYLLGRSMFNHRTGVYAALLLAATHMHIHFSRIGLNNIWDGLFFVLGILAVFQAWKTERRPFYLLAGFLLGFAQYFYTSSRLLLILIFIWLLGVGLYNRVKLKRSLPDIFIMGWTAVITVFPLAWFYITHPDDFFAPMKRAALLGPVLDYTVQTSGRSAADILVNELLKGVRAYTDVPLTAWYKPGVAILFPFAAGIFLLGLILLLIRWKGGQTWLLFAWLAFFSLIGGLSESSPAAQRYVGALPAVALVTAYGLNEIRLRIEKLWPRHAWMANTLVLVIVVGIMVNDVWFYFKKYTPESAVYDVNTTVAQHLANYLDNKKGNWEVLFFGFPRMGYRSISSLPYLAPNIMGLDVAAPWGQGGNPLPNGENEIFVFLPEHNEDIQPVMTQYPGGKLVAEYFTGDEVLYWLYEVSPLQPSQ